jgi:hypothetical protein
VPQAGEAIARCGGRENRRLGRAGSRQPDRVGVCGLSWGSAFSEYAIGHSRYFRAAIVDYVPNNPMNMLYLQNSYVRKSYEDLGLGQDAIDTSWKEVSLALRANEERGALLINAADREYLESLQAYWNLRDQNNPVEM